MAFPTECASLPLSVPPLRPPFPHSGGSAGRSPLKKRNEKQQYLLTINQSREKRRRYVGIEIASLYVERVIWRLVQLSSSNFRP
jgi:hypothetical protein